MSIISYSEARLVGGNPKEPRIFLGPAAQGAAWRRGDFLQNIVTGTLSTPPLSGTGALATSAGPLPAAITTSFTASAGAPAQSYYGQVSYTEAGQESQLSAPFIINVPAGFLPTVSVAAAGAPAGATNFAAYLGLQAGYPSLQQASRTTTALGATFTATNPLANSSGWNRSVTNPNAGLVGMAVAASNENFFDGAGGSFNIGAGSRTGANATMPPLAPTDVNLFYVAGLGQGQLFEINLSQAVAFYPSLVGTTAGLALDATSGFWFADPNGSNKILNIVDYRPGVATGPTNQGTIGDGGTRIVIEFNSGLAIS